MENLKQQVTWDNIIYCTFDQYRLPVAEVSGESNLRSGRFAFPYVYLCQGRPIECHFCMLQLLNN